MKTRMKLWKEYRESIENNIALQKSTESSNEKLNIIMKKLTKVFPDYFQKFPSKIKTLKTNIKELDKIDYISSENIMKIIEEIKDINNNIDDNFEFIDELSFQSDDLNSIIIDIKKHSIDDKKYVNVFEDEIIINKTQIVELENKMLDYRIAIDGPSGSGKSTVARKISNIYKLKYINTGLVYRGIAFWMINNNIELENEDSIKDNLKNIKIKLLRNEIIELNGQEISSELRTDIVSQKSSIIASYPFVRKFALKIQKEESTRKGIIMDGRDTTFKIMPNADIKIFLDSSAEVRAKRRVEQNKELGYKTNYENILEEIKIRDKRDRTRKVDPLHKTKDAYLIDSSNLNVDQVVTRIKEIITNKYK